ncbi:MAG: dehydrogenase [Paludibacteraceae bacterium]|nr:dehydrogenase [Paludibacteraceae bacterium]
MADNWLEKHFDEYERRRRQWQRRSPGNNTSREQQNPWSD